MLVPRLGALLLAVSLAAPQLHSQTAGPDAQPIPPTFQVKANTVVVDVVVTDSKGQPVAGLPMQNFEVRESGKPQTITFFEEHTGVSPDAPAPPSASAPGTPNTFTNQPATRVTGPVNVLLLDSLNTPVEDQSYVHAETMKYLKNVPAGTRLALFSLGNELHLISGVSTDLSIVSAALNGKSPRLSALLQSTSDKAAESEQSGRMKQDAVLAGLRGQEEAKELEAVILRLNEFQKQVVSAQTDVRVRQTLLAFQELGRYLAAIPGRKNVIWFSGSFPLNVFVESDILRKSTGAGGVIHIPTNFDLTRDYSEDVRKTADLLSAAQIAVYPIGAEGLATDRTYEAERNVTAGQGGGQQATNLRNEATDRIARHEAMNTIARETGGKAIYNTNGITEAIAQVVNDGTHYYTIAYTPTNKEANGTYRTMEVQLTSGREYKLAYRRGYYAADAKREKLAAQKQPANALIPYMDHGRPDSTQIAYTLHLVPSPTQPAADTVHAGDNRNLKGPTTRYQATFWLPVGSLRMIANPDGSHSSTIEAALVVYDADGKSLNWMDRRADVSLSPQLYARALQSGVPLRLEIDDPPAGVYLRTGIYEQETRSAGTLEVRLSQVTPSTAAAR